MTTFFKNVYAFDTPVFRLSNSPALTLQHYYFKISNNLKFKIKMKKVLLLFVLAVASIVLPAQTYKEYQSLHGKSYLIKGKEGKSILVQSNNLRENVKSEIKFSDPNVYKKEINLPSYTDNLNSRVTHHLTIHFDKNMKTNGDIQIVSDSTEIFWYDMTWSDDGLMAEIDLPENSYEIIAMYLEGALDTHDLSYVILHNLNIVEDTDTTINFAAMANHKIYLQCKDENGALLDPLDTTLLQKSVTIDIQLPQNSNLFSTSIQTSIPNGYINISDVSTEYKINLNQFNVRHGKLYITDMGQLTGITEDTTLQNNYSGYKKMDMVFHASPSSIDSNYLNFGYGEIVNFGEFYFMIMQFPTGANQDYPSYDKDILHVFMDNREFSANTKITFVPEVHFWEELPTWPQNNKKQMVSDPFFINVNDNITFTKFNVSAASPQYPDNSIVDLGNTAPFNTASFRNNMMGENTIYGYSTSYGQTNEERQMDRRFNIYEIKKGNEILVSDTLFNFTKPFTVTEQGVYTFNIANNNYVVNDQSGQCTFEASFDIGNADANPPVISSFKLLNAENFITNSFKNNELATVLLSSYDYNYSTYELDKPFSVQVFYKKFDENNWSAFNTIENPTLFDNINYGSFYTCDLSPALTQFTTPGYLDLKIISADSAGNTVTQILHPACEVINNATTPILSVTPVNQNVTAEEGTTQFSISNTGIGTMSYTAEVTSGTDWLTIVDGGSGNNSGILTLHYEVNNTSVPRVGTITVSAPGATGSPVNVTVTQTNIHVPTLTITHVENIVPGPVTIPVHAANVTNMGSFQFTINFDPSILTYDSVSNWYTGIDAVTVGNPSAGHLTFVWAADAEGINIPDGKFFDLNFNWLTSDGISTNLSWGDNPTPREFADYDGNIFVPDYVNGVEGGFGVGMPEIGSSSIKVFPNPAADVVNITISNDISTVQVMNYLGMVVYSENITQDKTITLNTSHYSTGNYLVRFVTNNGKTLIKKMVIIK